MSERGVFRQSLLDRLLLATGAGSAGLALAAACGGTTQIGQIETSDPGSSGGSGGMVSFSDAAVASGGANLGTGGTLGTGGFFFDSGGTAPDSSFLGRQDVHRCLDVPVVVDAGKDAAAPTCPAASAIIGGAYTSYFCRTWGDMPVAAIGEAKLANGQCCYDLVVESPCFVYVGRAFLVDEGLLKATMRKGGSWRAGDLPELRGLTAATRKALSEAWLKDGLFEHASVATFARFAMQLLAVGAPSRLLHETLAAGRDEIRHAELCFGLASAYAGEPLEPDRFPLDPEVHVETNLVGIIEETIVEGCIGETLAALQAKEQARRTSDPAVRAALDSTVDDETRHAELAWRVVAWALEIGGDEVRRAAARTFSTFRPPDAPTIDLTDVDLVAFEAHGRLIPHEARRVALEALDHVVRPCAAALLGIDVMGRNPATEGAPSSTNSHRRAAPRETTARA